MGCGDGEEVGDGREVGDAVKGLGRAFDEVGQPGIEERVLHCELVFICCWVEGGERKTKRSRCWRYA